MRSTFILLAVAITLVISGPAVACAAEASSTVFDHPTVVPSRYDMSYDIIGTLMSQAGNLSGRTVTLESAPTSIGPWGQVTTPVVTSEFGSFVFPVVPLTGTYYRVTFAGDPDYAPSTSDVVFLLQHAWVSTPIAPTYMYTRGIHTIYGSLMPRHPAGSYPVRIYRYRYVSGEWRRYGYITAQASDFSDFSRYSRAMRLPYTGRWKLRAYAPADAEHDAVVSLDYANVVVTSTYVGTPKAPEIMERGRACAVYGDLRPRHKAGSPPVRIYLWRKLSAGSWERHGYVLATASDYLSHSRYRASIRLPGAGTWRLRAFHPGIGYDAAWSNHAEYVEVR